MTHYEVLELPENASVADIRRAYRRLVLLTHPDRTPDPAAHARYLAINAAYEVLNDPGRRAGYDLARNNPMPMAPPVSSGRARDAARRAGATGRARTGPIPTSVLYATEYALTQRIAKPFMALALLLSICVVTDYLLATEQLERILSTETVLRGSGGRLQSNTTTASFNNHTAAGTFSALTPQPVGAFLWVQRTPLWHVAVGVRDAQHRPVAFMPLYSIPNAVMLLIMAVAASLALWPAFNAEYRLMSALLATVLLIVLIFALLH